MKENKYYAGIITEPGSSLKNKTYTWRDGLKPVWIKKNCINCLTCFINCPDRAIKVGKDGNMAGHNLNYCKGCGICAQVCPSKPKAIMMVKE
jgi:pyruvate ferredoxin oxidoreductase delta subunit